MSDRELGMVGSIAVGRRRFVASIAFVLAASLLSSPVDAQEAVLSDMALGSAQARVTIIEYASMTCPHCAEFHIKLLPALKEKYINTGAVRLVYRDFPLDGLAMRAAMTARCAGPERYFGFVDLFYQQQSSWTRAKDQIGALQQLSRIGGLTPEKFKTCLDNGALQEYVVKSRQQGEAEFGVSGTPTFVIEGKVYRGIETVEEFARIIDPVIAAKN
ncbi:MAG TPA: DsbA family protein [Lacipirellulaceae bacterium]|mgnify:CR=1 FL=1|nr:DsbA family protein [Lacipirellulaceae bacterium]